VESSSIRILNEKGPRVELCGTPDNTEKGEEKLPKMRMKEDL
jgi:hypothetical protein